MKRRKVVKISCQTTRYYLSGICWDQWFPEAARAMVLQGAEILLYPTAIGSEPRDTELDSRHHWRRVMQGHAGANVVIFIIWQEYLVNFKSYCSCSECLSLNL